MVLTVIQLLQSQSDKHIELSYISHELNIYCINTMLIQYVFFLGKVDPCITIKYMGENTFAELYKKT